MKDGASFVHELREGMTVVRVQGEIDLSTAPLLRAAIEAPDRLIVDLSECRYMDSSGLAVLIGKRRTTGRAFPVVIPAASFLRKLFTIASADKIFTLPTTVHEALREESSQSDDDSAGPGEVPA